MFEPMPLTQALHIEEIRVHKKSILPAFGSMQPRRRLPPLIHNYSSQHSHARKRSRHANLPMTEGEVEVQSTGWDTGSLQTPLLCFGLACCLFKNYILKQHFLSFSLQLKFKHWTVNKQNECIQSPSLLSVDRLFSVVTKLNKTGFQPLLWTLASTPPPLSFSEHVLGRTRSSEG